jgi:glycosyltransferase involved in cell wall biosynthesis
MRITYITAGAGGMYCGSCIRDNALATALMKEGHEVLLLPMYTPLLTDETNVSAHRVFFGGISVYLEQYLPVFRHTPWLLDRVWEAPWLLRTVSGLGIQTKPEELGALTVSVLEGRHGRQAKEIEKLIHWLRNQPRPDVIDISNSMLIALARPLKEALGGPICCTLQGENVFLDHLREPYRARALKLIRASVAYVDRFLAVSDYYAEYMSGYLGIPGAKLDVVPLGINVDGYEPRARNTSGGFTVGYFGRVAPEKGVHLLCDAYHRMRQRADLKGSTLKIAGYLAPEHETYLESIMTQAREWGLSDEVSYHGTLDREHKISFLRSLDVLGVPSLYDDPKGLVLLEAMACGVPVVAPRRGTYTEFIERTGGGVLVQPHDVESLANALQSLASDPTRCQELGEHGALGIRERYTARGMAERAADVYLRVASGGAPVKVEPAAG